MKERPNDFFNMTPNSIRRRKNSSFEKDVTKALFDLTADLDDFGEEEVEIETEVKLTEIFGIKITGKRGKQKLFMRKFGDGVVVGYGTFSEYEER